MRVFRVQGSGFSPITAAALALGFLGTGVALAEKTLSEDEILGQASARIEKFRMGEVTLRVLDGDQPVAAGTKVAVAQTRHAFLFGSNVFMLNRSGDAKLNEAYARQFAELCNYATLPFYWWNYEPVEGQPNHRRTDAMIEWCKEQGIACKGHPLAWNFVDPRWLPKEPAAAMLAELNRIVRDMTRFKGAIRYWDVVNEATAYDRADTQRGAPILTEAIRQAGVPAYIRGAFKTARKTDPTAQLVINDYVTDQSYADKVISKLVDDEGKSLYDVIGIQCHQHGRVWPVKEIWEICERFAKFGKPLHFTEATITSGKIGWGLSDKGEKWESTPEGEKRQAEDVARFYTVLFSHPAVEAITWWDFSDNGAWQNAPAGFLRKDMTPKPAYDALKGLIKGKWWTRTEAEVGANGEVKVRGFLGEYEVRVGAKRGKFVVKKGDQGVVEVWVGTEN